MILYTIIVSSCTQPNSAPKIISLRSQEYWVAPSGSIEIECLASDVDGDSLTYTWSATGGNLIGGSSTLAWIAPQDSGDHIITCQVTDGRGGEAIRQLRIDVRNQAPIIKSLTAEPPEVLRAGISLITCIASDPDGYEISYTWAASRGNISGEGSSVFWTAPDTCGNYIIELTATNVAGAKTSQELIIKVITPG